MRVMLFPLLCASLMLQGCLLLVVGAGAGAGAGTLAYVRGELQTTYAAPLNRTWDAALGALKDLAIPVNSAKKDELGGTIEATRSDGKVVKITLETAGPGTTTVKIRVGMFGDEEASKAINRRIGERLGMKAGLGGSASSLRLATRPECPPADDVPTEMGIA